MNTKYVEISTKGRATEDSFPPQNSRHWGLCGRVGRLALPLAAPYSPASCPLRSQDSRPGRRIHLFMFSECLTHSEQNDHVHGLWLFFLFYPRFNFHTFETRSPSDVSAPMTEPAGSCRFYPAPHYYKMSSVDLIYGAVRQCKLNI